MSQACDIESVNKAFGPARDHWETIIYQLHEDAADHMQHDQVEVLIKKDGNEVMRLLLQGFLDVRAKREERMESVEGSDGVVRTHCRENCERSLMTEFGKVTVERKGYSAKGAESLFPLDAALNLPQDKYSSELCRLVARTVADSSLMRVWRTSGEQQAARSPNARSSSRRSRYRRTSMRSIAFREMLRIHRIFWSSQWMARES